MKILMWHCKEFDVKITGISDRPKNIVPEPQRNSNEKMKKCILAMITVEKQDTVEIIQKVTQELEKFAKDTKSKNLVLMPFVHLSNNIADSEKTLTIINSVEESIKHHYNILRSHFGYHKELILHTFGHKTNVRFREI